ncbi:c-type cytochrome [Polynucleobacter sp. AP-Nino-20-G2]|uniref:c-type cytochrome n=1 Tax=Polynucleobacter sp. AP-Nino-20-G2 TaxID=2576917 RepID=UPI001BFDA069|nr:c-type cytochrome [Polynucleobacter sp. AP-Nino-20-G2]QWE16694.1 cytochrome c, class I [Polynucleobacter sp. AP-Nino-20-G2]
MVLIKRYARCVLAVAILASCSARALADTDATSAQRIAKQNACLGCHAVNKKIVGPSFQDVAKKYATDPNAKVFLKNKILKGGSGSWGVVPMPANAKLSDVDLSLLVAWVLLGAPNGN